MSDCEISASQAVEASMAGARLSVLLPLVVPEEETGILYVMRQDLETDGITGRRPEQDHVTGVYIGSMGTVFEQTEYDDPGMYADLSAEALRRYLGAVSRMTPAAMSGDNLGLLGTFETGFNFLVMGMGCESDFAHAMNRESSTLFKKLAGVHSDVQLAAFRHRVDDWRHADIWRPHATVFSEMTGDLRQTTIRQEWEKPWQSIRVGRPVLHLSS